MIESNSPMFLWYYTTDYFALIHAAVPHPLFQAQDKTPHECTFGNQSEISNIFNFGWHEWVNYRNFGSFP